MKMLRKLLFAPLMALLIAVPLVPMTGCTSTAAQVKADGAAIASAIGQIASLEMEQGNTALATSLTTAADALEAATANFQTGSATSVINDAATALEVALAAIPATAVYAPLLPIAVAAIDALIANIGGSATAPVQTASASGLLQARLMRVSDASPQGLAALKAKARAVKIHHRRLRSAQGDFKAAWNAAVKANRLPASLSVK